MCGRVLNAVLCFVRRSDSTTATVSYVKLDVINGDGEHFDKHFAFCWFRRGYIFVAQHFWSRQTLGTQWLSLPKELGFEECFYGA